MKQSNPCLTIQAPPKDHGVQPLFRVVYTIDVSADDPRDAAEYTHRIMTDPESMPPMLQIIDHIGKCVTIDLAEQPSAGTEAYLIIKPLS